MKFFDWKKLKLKDDFVDLNRKNGKGIDQIEPRVGC